MLEHLRLRHEPRDLHVARHLTEQPGIARPQCHEDVDREACEPVDRLPRHLGGTERHRAQRQVDQRPGAQPRHRHVQVDVLARDDDRALALVRGEGRIPAEQYDVSDAAVLAGGGYVRIFDGWRPEPSDVPTLLLQAGPTKEMLAQDPDRDWRPRWPLPHDVAEIPGDHGTVLTEHPATTAEVIREWIRGRQR